jgi:hypothetical protein
VVVGAPVWLALPPAVVGCVAGVAILVDRTQNMVTKSHRGST